MQKKTKLKLIKNGKGVGALRFLKASSRYTPCNDFRPRGGVQRVHYLRASFLGLSKPGKTGIEPAASSVTGWCSNQLSYFPYSEATYGEVPYRKDFISLK